MLHLLKGFSKQKKLFLEGNCFIGDFFKEPNFWNLRDPFNRMKQFKEASEKSGYDLVVFRKRNMIELDLFSEDRAKASKILYAYQWHMISQPSIMNQHLYTEELYYQLWGKLGCQVFYPDLSDRYLHLRYAVN